MRSGNGRHTPFWRAREARIVRPELWVLAVLVVGMLLCEVGQTARMTELGMKLDHARNLLTQERSLVVEARVKLDDQMPRTEQERVAQRLGLAPMLAAQQVDLPAAYLAMDEPSKDAAGAPRMAWLDRVTHALIPDATARSRSGS